MVICCYCCCCARHCQGCCKFFSAIADDAVVPFFVLVIPFSADDFFVFTWLLIFLRELDSFLFHLLVLAMLIAIVDLALLSVLKFHLLLFQLLERGFYFLKPLFIWAQVGKSFLFLKTVSSVPFSPSACSFPLAAFCSVHFLKLSLKYFRNFLDSTFEKAGLGGWFFHTCLLVLPHRCSKLIILLAPSATLPLRQKSFIIVFKFAKWVILVSFTVKLICKLSISIFILH